MDGCLLNNTVMPSENPEKRIQIMALIVLLVSSEYFIGSGNK